MLTTDNPGAFKGRKLPSFRRFIKSLIIYFLRFRFKVGIYYLISHTINFIQKHSSLIFPQNYYCPCCESSNHYFIHLSNHTGITWNSACPNCDSRSRHRGLTLYLKTILPKSSSPSKFLHFAPEPILSSLIKSFPNIDYKTSDLFLKDVDFPNQNLTSLKIQDDRFDIVLCNHVLEHIQNDNLAVLEIKRILKPNGCAIITVPGNFKKSKTVQYKCADTNGHFRHYGLDFLQSLQTFFSKVELIKLHELSTEFSYGIQSPEIAFQCIK